MIDRLDAARDLPENKRPLRQFAIAAARRILKSTAVADPGFPAEITQCLPVDPLKKAIEEYGRGPLTPEIVTNFWRTKLAGDGKKIGLNFPVPDCDWDIEAIRRPMRDFRGQEILGMMVYLPDVFLGGEGLKRLSSMYPNLHIGTGFFSTDTHQTTGWIKVEAAVDAPNLDTDQQQLGEFASQNGYRPQRLRTYVLASEASKQLNGQLFDENGTTTRLLGTLENGNIGATLYSDGSLHVLLNFSPATRSLNVGGRFEEVKK